MEYDIMKITGVPKHMKQEFKNVADHKGVSVSQQAKQIFREYLDKQPERYRKKFEDYSSGADGMG